jgi:hypothetical protein
MLRSQVGSQLWKIRELKLKLILSGKRLERISNFQATRVWVIMNRRSISHCVMNDAPNYYFKANTVNCSGYRIQKKYFEIT